jgi:hypothetical protein
MTRLLALLASILVFAARGFAPALALDLPTRKAGLWELKMVFEGRNLPDQVMKQCVDAATDKLMNANFGGSNEQACSKQDVTKSGGTFTIDSVCTFGGAVSTSHAVITGSFDSAYTMDVAIKREGASPGGQRASGESHMKIEAKWRGACAAGQKPGDVIMSNGMSMNVLDMQRMRGAPKQP